MIFLEHKTLCEDKVWEVRTWVRFRIVVDFEITIRDITERLTRQLNR